MDPLFQISRICDEQPHDALTQIAVVLGFTDAPHHAEAVPARTETREELAKRLIGEVKAADEIATAVCRSVAELGDRNSPEDWPEAMLVTQGEMHLIVREAVIASQPTGVPAQGDAELDTAFEAVRRRLCKLPRYSFHSDGYGAVRRVNDKSGSWIEFSAAHELFDPVAVDAAIAQTKESGS